MNGSWAMSRVLGGAGRQFVPTRIARSFTQSSHCLAEPVQPKLPTAISSMSAEHKPQTPGNEIKREIPAEELLDVHTSDAAQKLSKAQAEIREPSKIQRLPMSVQAIYLRPLKHSARYGVPSCDLQLRSYSLRPLEFYSDFALRAAYYLGLAAYGPVPLPQLTERWTVPRSHFIFKKSQENFERVTKRRLIQIRDGDPEVVQVWLAFLRKHAFYGVGMKANVWEFSELGVGKTMDAELPESETVQHAWEHFAQDRPYKFKDMEKLEQLIESPRFVRPYRDSQKKTA